MNWDLLPNLFFKTTAVLGVVDWFVVPLPFYVFYMQCMPLQITIAGSYYQHF